MRALKSDPFRTAIWMAALAFGTSPRPAISLGEPREVWRAALGAPIVAPPAIYPTETELQNVLAVTAKGMLLRLDREGRTAMQFDAGEPIHAAPAVGNLDASPEAEIVIGTAEGRAIALTGEGKRIWEYRMRGRIDERRAPMLVDLDGDERCETILTDDEGEVVALTPEGRKLWSFKADPYRASTPGAADLDGDGKPEIVYGTENERIIALGADGRMKWIRRLKGKFGRGAPTLGDLNGDGLPEAIVSETFNTPDPRLWALDGATGAPLWEARTLMWGYGGIALADLGRDQKIDVIYADRSNTIYRYAPDGKEIWRRRLDGGGIYHAPIAADLDGEGLVEIVYSIRYGGWGILNDKGEVVFERKDEEANATAIVGEFDGEGAMDLAIPLMNKGEIVVLTFGGPNKAYAPWPQQRGNAARTGEIERGRDAQVTPVAAQPAPPGFLFGLTFDLERRMGILLQSESALTKETGLFEIAVRHGGGSTQTSLHEFADEAFFEIETSGPMSVTAARWDQSRGMKVAESVQSKSVPAFVIPQDKTSGPARDWAKGLELDRIDSEDELLVWIDPNPWDESLSIESSSRDVELCLSELECHAVVIGNDSANTVTVQVRPKGPATAAIELREAIAVPIRGGANVIDALPRMNDARTITLPPMEPRVVWVNISAKGLAIGENRLELEVVPLKDGGQPQKITFNVKVHDIDLADAPEFMMCNWARPSQFFEDGYGAEAAREAAEFGMNVWIVNSPAYQANAEGEIAPPDFAALERELAVLHRDSFLLVGFSFSAAAGTEEGGEAYLKGYGAALRHFAAELEKRGWPTSRWALYPVDEPGLFGEARNTREFIHKAGLARKAAPEIQIYANPAGWVTKENFADAFALGNVWAPELGMLLRSPELVDWFKSKGGPVWCYEAPGDAKKLKPLGFYRSQPWIAWSLGLTGAGFWVFSQPEADDLWSARGGGEWAANYTAGGKLVLSRRWHAVREGIEDVRAFMLLERLAGEAEKEARLPRVTKAARELLSGRIPAAIEKPKSADDITRHMIEYDPDLAEIRAIRSEAARLTLALQAERMTFF